MKKQIISTLYLLGAITASAGYISYAFQWEFAPYCITIGGTLIALAQINAPYRGDNLILKRLYRKQTFASLFIIAAGACMLYTSGNEWLILTIIATVIYLYTSFRIPIVERDK